VTGTVVEVNEELATAPEKINSDAHQTWLLKVEISDPKEVESLLSAADYEKFVKEETH
jgi:glycine cleavage system H protein